MLIKLKNLFESHLDANQSSNFETLRINSVLVMSSNISLEELLGIKKMITNFILVAPGSIAFINR
jgi:hypothetical protein